MLISYVSSSISNSSALSISVSLRLLLKDCEYRMNTNTILFGVHFSSRMGGGGAQRGASVCSILYACCFSCSVVYFYVLLGAQMRLKISPRNEEPFDTSASV